MTRQDSTGQGRTRQKGQGKAKTQAKKQGRTQQRGQGKGRNTNAKTRQHAGQGKWQQGRTWRRGFSRWERMAQSLLAMMAKVRAQWWFSITLMSL